MTYLPASYKGVRFHVIDVRPDKGKRLKVHNFPKRDQPYTESFGRKERAWSFRAFLVGADAQFRQSTLAAACEADGAGLLTLPSEGAVLAECVSISHVESREHVRVVMLDLSFVEKGSSPTLIASIATGPAVESAASAAISLFAATFAEAVEAMEDSGRSLVSAAVIECADKAERLYITATDPVSHARFRLTLSDLKAAPLPATAAATALPAAVSYLAAAVAPAVTGAAAAAAEQLTMATATPDEQRVTVFAQPSEVVPEALDAPEYELVATFARRIWLVEEARALAALTLRSRDQAEALRLNVSARFDAEIEIAAVERDAEVLAVLRPLHAAVVRDLVDRGRPLPSMRRVALPRAMPALVIAHRLWQDASRAAELVKEADAYHPGFMPREFLALSV